MKEIDLLKKKIAREKSARKAAERILEERALQLYESNEKLRKLNIELEIKVEKRAKQLIKSEEKYRGIIENMELGLLEVDNDQMIIKAYKWFCDMTGYREDELIGKNAQTVFLSKTRHHTIISQEQTKRIKGQAGVYEIQIKHKQGHLIWVMISGCPVYDADGNVCGSMGIHYDITRQKKLQKALLEAKKVAENAQKAEQLFLAKMSHEIRTPLNAIIGMTHLLNATKPSEEQKDYLKILRDSSGILKLLISDILDFSKIQAGELEVQKSEFNLSILISRLLKAVQSQIDGKDIKVKSNIDPNLKNLIIGDELLLNQILINLLSNAVKFTKKGSIILNVVISSQSESEISVEFQICDTGRGIEKGKTDLIFQKFKQVSSTDKDKYNGTGLGLAITKQLVELQNGTIELTSKKNKGSTFSVFLNYEKGGLQTDEDDLIPNKYLEQKFNKQKILVVEDNYMNRKYILTLLSKWNLDYEVAVDGMEAIAITKTKKFDLIFMDISMPILNGYEATKKIRKISNPNQETTIIALSASAFVTKKEKAISIGMTDFLCKPFDPQSLFRLLVQYLNPQIENISSENKPQSNIFPLPINAQQIELLYGDNWSMAFEMFNIFLKNSLPSFEKFKRLADSENFVAVKNLAHKLAPNLAMVGLMKTQDRLLNLESMAHQPTDKEGIRKLIDEIINDLQLAKPIVEKCLIALQEQSKLTQTT